MPNPINSFPIQTVSTDAFLVEMDRRVAQANTAVGQANTAVGQANTAAEQANLAADRAADSAGETILQPSVMQITVTSDHQPYNTQQGLLNTVLADIASLNSAATFHLGDLVHAGDLLDNPTDNLDGIRFNNYMTALQASGQNMQVFFPIAGNHDIENYEPASPYTNGTGTSFYDRFRRPPVYAITSGNMAYIFCGYENFKSVEQINSNTVMKALESLLRQFDKSHNVFLFTHAPLEGSGIFNRDPTKEWFRLKPESSWNNLFNNYKIAAHFCGHSATDIINANETTIKTVTTVSYSSGTTTHVLTGPHIEQRHWNPNHALGSRVLVLNAGSNSVTVRTRDHLNQTWVTGSGKQFVIPVPFPITLHSVFEDHSINVKGPLIRGPLNVLVGPGDPNETGTSVVQSRRVPVTVEWEESFNGDIPLDAETLMRISGPTDNVTVQGPSIMIGARNLSASDSNLMSGIVVYSTNAAGGEELVLAQNTVGQVLFRGNYYPCSQIYPMWQAQYNGVTVPDTAGGPITISYTSRIYDDFVQLELASGRMTCSQLGVYDVTGRVQFNGAVDAFEDIISLRLKRVRGGTATYYGSAEYTLEKTNANSRQNLWCHAKVGLLLGDTLELEVQGWQANNKHTITSASFSGHLIRGV